jgi:hypothetical protein
MRLEILEEYDKACEWCAARGLTGTGVLPLLSAECRAAIDDDPEAFEERVRGFAYARAMESREGESK